LRAITKSSFPVRVRCWYSIIWVISLEEIAVGNRTQIDVRLAEDNNVLDDVVVVGYGTQSRRTLTSAVSKVSGADLEGVPVNSIGDALKGKVPGVRVSTANNQPGSDPVFLIRGGSSINQSNAPIIIVDASAAR